MTTVTVVLHLLLWTKSLIHPSKASYSIRKLKNTSIKHTQIYPFKWLIWADQKFPMSSTKSLLEWEQTLGKKVVNPVPKMFKAHNIILQFPFTIL